MLSLTVPGKSWLHRMPVAYKLGFLFFITLFFVPVADWRPALAALLGVGLLYLSVSRRFARVGLSRIRPLFWLVAIIIVYHLVTARALEGLGIGLKILALVGLANLVTMTSLLDDMMGVANWLARPFHRLGLPPKALGLSMGLVVRFTPVFLQKGQLLRDAWRARSPKRPSPRLMVPLALGALDDADRVADAIKARGGLGPSKTNT